MVKSQEYSSYEYRVKSLSDQVSALQATLTEREATISKLRLELATASVSTVVSLLA